MWAECQVTGSGTSGSAHPQQPEQQAWHPSLDQTLDSRLRIWAGLGPPEALCSGMHPHKFIKRTFKRRVNSTKQLLNVGSLYCLSFNHLFLRGGEQSIHGLCILGFENLFIICPVPDNGGVSL